MTTNPKQTALERLHQGVSNLITSAGWQAALKFRNNFHTYSFFNTLLIQSQHPTAQLVCGYRKWQQLGRQVNKGEKAITILAPLLRKDPNNPDQKILTGFKGVNVFDITQTTGQPIPTTPRPKLLQGDNQQITTAITALEALCTKEAITLDRRLNHPNAYGVYRPHNHSISLKPGLPKLQELKTFVHELAHALLHDQSSDRTQAELEAESAAFLTLDQLGLDTSNYSFAYLANWTKDIETLITAGHNASKAANHILNHLRTAASPGDQSIGQQVQPPTPQHQQEGAALTPPTASQAPVQAHYDANERNNS